VLGEGQQFAGYTVVRFLGAGGMGEVYLAQHPRLPRRRDALKLLGRDISADPAFRKRFLREADLASTLSHPHIVGVYDVGEDQGQLWIAMDYIDGEDAAQLLRRRYPAGMPAELAAAIITAVGSALDYAHSKGLLHRDVKPANILLSNAEDPSQRQILLTDFGIARALDDVSDLTPTNTTLGTVAYSAPEQLMGQELDGRADQYALAATAYHLLAGTPMFPASNAAVIIGHHLSADPPPLSGVRPELAAVDPVLRAALAKKAQDRFASCTAFARAFAEQLGSAAPAPAAPTAPAPITPTADSPRRARALPPPVGQPQRAAAKPAAAADARQAAVPPKAARSRRSQYVLAGGVAAAGIAGAALAFSFLTKDDGSADGVASTTAQPPTVSTQTPPPTTTAASTVTPTTTAAAPAAVKPSAIDSLMLTPAEVRTATRGEFIGLTGGDMIVKDSSYGQVDNSAKIDPPTCVGVIFGNDYLVYGDSGVEQIRTENLAPSNYAGDKSIEQTVAIFPDPQSAQASLDSQIRQWQSCYRHVRTNDGFDPPAAGTMQVGQRFGEGGITWTLGDVNTSWRGWSGGVVSTMPMVGYSNLEGYRAGCQVAWGAKANVVIRVRACEGVSSSPAVLTDLSYARGDYAQSLTTAIMDKIVG